MLRKEIEKRYTKVFSRQNCIRIEQWSKKLCQAINNQVFKKIRNNYALILLEQTLRKKLEKPFCNLPSEDNLPPLISHIPKFEDLMCAKNSPFKQNSIAELEKDDLIKKTIMQRNKSQENIKNLSNEISPIKINENIGDFKENDIHNEKFSEGIRAFIELKQKTEEIQEKQEKFKLNSELIKLKSEKENFSNIIQNLRKQLLVFFNIF